MLNLGGNVINEVPATVGRLSHLQALTLNDNLIENLPASISHLKELKSLLLHRNRLRTLPLEIIALKHLTEVRIYLYIKQIIWQFKMKQLPEGFSFSIHT